MPVGVTGLIHPFVRCDASQFRELTPVSFAATSYRFEAPLLLATMAFQAGDKAGMENWTREGLKAAPWHPGLLFFLGLLAAEDGKLDVAEAVFAAAVTVNPLHQASQFALANCLLRRDETERAAVHLRSTVRIGGKTEQGKAAAALLKRIDGT